MYSNAELQSLALLTLGIYKDALQVASKAVILNWRALLAELGLLLAVGLLLFPLAHIGGLAGGFLLGMVFVLVLSSFLSLVSAGVAGEKLRLKELWPETQAMFSPVLNVVFVFFIVGLVFSFLFKGAAGEFLILAVNLVVTVLLNPLPEVMYTERGGAVDSFQRSVEFVRENVVEWFVPYAVIAGVVYLLAPEIVSGLFLVVFTTNPLRMIEAMLVATASSVMLLPILWLVPLLFVVVFFILVFRGVLYQKLSRSTRRKRLYQAKMT